MKKGVLIIECIERNDPGSEGRFLSHLLNVMNIECQYLEVRTPDQFINFIKTTPYRYIHVTTHGYTDINSFQGWWTAKGIISKENLRTIRNAINDTIIVSTACNSGEKTYSDYLTRKLGVKYYIAPTGSPKFHNSLFFIHIFYHKHFILKLSIEKCIKSYNNLYKNPHKFKVFTRNVDTY